MAVGRRFGALAGVAAAAVALAAAELVAVATGPRSAPLVAVGGVVVDTVPEPVKAFAIEVFGFYDKIALLVGTVLLLAAFAALVGVAAGRSLRAGYAGIALFGVVGVAAALTRPGATALSALPALVGAGAAGAALWLLLRDRVIAGTATDTGTDADADATAGKAAGQAVDGAGQAVGGAGQAVGGAEGRGRRTVLAMIGGAAVLGLGARVLSTRRDVSAVRAGVVLPAPASPAPPVPAGADLRLPRLAPYVTDNASFYLIDTALVVPQVDPRAWRLRVHGRVRRPLELTFADLLARPMVERHITLCCVSNEVGGDLIGNARWLGVPVRDLLDQAEPVDGADQVVSRSVDGWTCGTPTAVLRDGRDALLAVGMNGEPLPVAHGFPVRMVTPGLYGYVSACKWLVELELTTFAEFDAYWVRRGWAQQAAVKTQSRIDVPRRGAEVASGPTMVAGVAWAQHRGIIRVEVRVDGGEWQEATLAETVSVDTWRQWHWVWPATPGRHRLSVRATDGTRQTQTGMLSAPIPDGATGWDTIEVTVA
ncbi:MAG TPA: molybdopterin-dependent oxidoreductase [Micromonosporaceae bacterium]|nr:molybdopterin-dependent oxidoreductase [Micromonosporaceae bacterium]